MAELLLHVTLLDVGRRGKSGAQRLAREQQRPLPFREIGGDAGGDRHLLDQAGDVLVGEPFDVDGLVVLEDAAEQGSTCDAAKADPALERDYGVGVVAGAAADLDLAPAGLAAQGDQQPLPSKIFDPAGAIAVVVAHDVETDDLGAPQAAATAQEQNSAVAQALRSWPRVAIIASRSSPGPPLFAAVAFACLRGECRQEPYRYAAPRGPTAGRAG